MKKFLILLFVSLAAFSYSIFAGTPCTLGGESPSLSGCNYVPAVISNGTDLTLTNGIPANSVYYDVFTGDPSLAGTYDYGQNGYVNSYPYFSQPFTLTTTNFNESCNTYPCEGLLVFMDSHGDWVNYGDTGSVSFSYDGDGHFTVTGGSARFLGFPLPNLTPYTATISAVFDHSVSTGFNCSNGVVTTYTDEQGMSGNGESNWSTTATGSSCSGSLYGLTKASGTFSLGGQYDSYDTGGTSHNVYLFYDGHTGYDYPASDANGGTSVLAAAAGTAYYEGSNNDVKIDHGNGYFTYYLHLQSRTITTDGQTVAKGEEIGKTGSGHLHFTVKKGTTRVDPYGWTGTGADPLQIDGHDNICLWDACP